jgi:hypothetical protein
MRNWMTFERSPGSTVGDLVCQVKKRVFRRQFSDDERTGLFVFLGLVSIAILVSAAVIFRGSGVVPSWPMDQSFAHLADLHIGRENGHWVFHYPSLQNSGGIASVLIAGLYKLIVPTSKDNLN